MSIPKRLPDTFLPNLSAKGLSLYYGSRNIFRDLNLEIPLGSRYWISGPNGSGKSSLLRCLAGLQRPSKGSVAIGAGSPLDTQAGRQEFRRQWNPAFLAEEPNFYPSLSLAENLRFASAVASASNVESDKSTGARCSFLLESLGLDGYLNSVAGSLSRGERRKLSILVTLLSEPKLLYLDEPFVALDGPGREAVLSVLQALAAETTILLVSHDQLLSAELCESHFELSRC